MNKESTTEAIIEFRYQDGRQRWGADLADEIWCYFDHFGWIALMTEEEARYMDGVKNFDAARPRIWKIVKRSGGDV